MFEYLESISITEGEQIKKTIQALFRQTCILQVKYDPATLVPKDNVQYEICVRHRHFIEDYLSVLGCELTHDAQEHIFCLTGDGAAREKLNMTETVILLIIKLIYKDGRRVKRSCDNAERNARIRKEYEPDRKKIEGR